jgi:hypothetical protein
MDNFAFLVLGTIAFDGDCITLTGAAGNGGIRWIHPTQIVTYLNDSSVLNSKVKSQTETGFQCSSCISNEQMIDEHTPIAL